MKRLVHKIAVLGMIAVLLCMFNAVMKDENKEAPKAEHGVMNLNGWDFEGNGIVQLDGEWEFYWNQLITPEQFKAGDIQLNKEEISVPSKWRKSDKGYATYRLKVNLDEKHPFLVLNTKDILTTYKIWVNGKLLDEAGKVGASVSGSVPNDPAGFIPISTKDNKLDIVIQVSNFHFRKGGIWRSIQLGTRSQLVMVHERKIAMEMFIMGCTLMIGLYHIVLFFFRTKEKSNLFFGILCICLALRAPLLGERFIRDLMPNVSWQVWTKFEYFTIYIAMPAMTLYLHSLFPQEVNDRCCRAIIFSAAIGGVGTIIFGTYIASYVMMIYQAIIAASVVYMMYVTILACIRKREGADYFIIGAFILGISVLNDILYFCDIGGSKGIVSIGNVYSLGVVCFVWIQSIITAMKFKKSFVETAQLSNELKKINENLENLVKERTEELAKINRKITNQKIHLMAANRTLRQLSLLDGLTNLSNRRHFDEMIKQEWNRAVRSKSRISLIFIDIDYFKQFNDNYGHTEGDECLIRIAEVLRASAIRPKDVVARYGGEEFTVLLPEVDETYAYEVAQDISEKIKDMHIVHECSKVSKWVTVSIGLATCSPCEEGEYEKLIVRADTALYEAKDSGRNAIHIYADDHEGVK